MTENLKGIIDNSDNDALIDTTKVIKDIAMNYVSPVEYVKKNITEDTSDNFDSDINEKVSSDCQNIVIDNKPGNNKVTISVDNKTNAVCITINPDNSSKEAVR